ncbi:hypothetical protein CKO31_09570 [Thiohalocapsa halophila]|uniref:PEP-CTERM sorting domain-containing protein n=1 Tax=Thiohalocapsa halophila TaxID=69359 RepID=A0ABS1CGJ9_9GAMM|nr:VPLPA-CTERM sorting domain-containing protein [Thiohalocapsa halophila]MBK1630983.1 hypothetical protein [Thiohalocapsa halophila]
MLDDKPGLKWSATVLVVLVALFGAGVATAKPFTTSDSVKDFRMDQGKILYTTPSLDQVSWQLTERNQVVMIEQAELRTGLSSDSAVAGSLNLKISRGDKGSRGRYMIFGSRDSGDSESTSRLMTGALEAMQSASDEESLAFMFTGRPTTGSDGITYQSIGIYASVYGINEQDFLAHYNSQPLSIPLGAQSSRMDRQAANAPAGEAPLPATPLLVIAGLVGLGILRRR